MKTDTLHGISNPPLMRGDLRKYVAVSITDTDAPRSMINFVIQETSRGS